MRRGSARSHASQGPHVAARPPGQRQLRVGEELRHALAWILEKGDIRDPALASRAVTVTEVQVSPDLRNATVFVVPLGGGEDAEAETLEGLRRVKPFLRHELARRITLRHVPDLGFELDTSFDTADRIEALLHRPDVARDLDHESGDEGPDAPESGKDDGA